MQNESTPSKPKRLRLTSSWFKRMGVAGFVFFLLKGLLWLLVPGLLTFLGFAD